MNGPRGRGLGSLSSEQLNNSLFGWVGRAGEAGPGPHGGGIQEPLGAGLRPPAGAAPPICGAGPRTPSAGSTGRRAGPGPGWRRGAPSSTGRSPAGPGRRLSRPAGTLCRRRTAGGRWGREGRLGPAQGMWAPAPPPRVPRAEPTPQPGSALGAGGTHVMISWMLRSVVQFFSMPGTWPMPTTPTTTEGTHFLGSAVGGAACQHPLGGVSAGPPAPGPLGRPAPSPSEERGSSRRRAACRSM